MVEARRPRKVNVVAWDEEIVPALVDCIRIPNISPAFDPDRPTTGHMEKAVELFESWRASVC